VARWLLARGVAVELGEPWRAPAGAIGDELASVVARVRALFDLPAGREPEATPAAK
jgi:hypothetical protein